MMSVTFDSYAWVEYLSGSRKGERVRAIVDGSEQIYTPVLCLMEIKAKYIREGKPYAEALKFICERSALLEVNRDIALEAANIKEDEKLPTIDALMLACARSCKTSLLSGDLHFKGKAEVEFLD